MYFANILILILFSVIIIFTTLIVTWSIKHYKEVPLIVIPIIMFTILIFMIGHYIATSMNLLIHFQKGGL
jgi:hypothetical protein